MKDNYKALTYESVLEDRQKFIQAGTRNGSDFNFFDTPGTKFFKLVFYFYNSDVNARDFGMTGHGGFLAPTWMEAVGDKNDIPYMHNFNSAWSYLHVNDEIERRDQLEKFINLLSNINTESPWYFSELSGLGEALNRTQIGNNNFIFEEQRKKITIKCLPDAYDDRISTLMDLYRSIVWSWQTKREIVPSNLRKFDMGVYIFNDPIKNFHKLDTRGFIKLIKTKDTYEYASFDDNDNLSDSIYKTSYKYIEFHNCEFDYNSGTAVYDSLNNKEGIVPTFDINIFYDDCYETRYNEFLIESIGDMIIYDVVSREDANFHNEQINYHKQKAAQDLDKRANIDKKGFLKNAVNNLIGAGTSAVNSFVKKIALGNLHSLRLSDLAKLGESVLEGDVFSTASSVRKFISDDKTAASKTKDHIGEIFEEPKPESPYTFGDLFVEEEQVESPVEEMSNIFPSTQVESPVEEMSNIFPSTPNKIQSSVSKDKIFIGGENILRFKLGNIFKTNTGNMFKATTLVNNL